MHKRNQAAVCIEMALLAFLHVYCWDPSEGWYDEVEEPLKKPLTGLADAPSALESRSSSSLRGNAPARRPVGLDPPCHAATIAQVRGVTAEAAGGTRRHAGAAASRHPDSYGEPSS